MVEEGVKRIVERMKVGEGGGGGGVLGNTTDQSITAINI